MKAGVIIRGRVTDPDGKPIKDAIVVRGDNPYDGRTTSTFSTDADGRFRLPALPPGKTALTVIAPGLAPQYRPLDLRPDLPPLDFRMTLGKPVRLRIVDVTGKPVPKAYVSLDAWKGSKSIDSNHNPNHPKVPESGIPGRADSEVEWTWLAAPDDPVKVRVYAKGFRPARTGGHRRLDGPHSDAQGRASHHRSGHGRREWEAGPRLHRCPRGRVPERLPTYGAVQRDRREKSGRLDFLADRTDANPLRLRVEAPGYRTQDGPEFRVGDDSNRTQIFRLQPSRPVTGLVVDVNGKPAPKAEVLLSTPTETAHADRRRRGTTDRSRTRLAASRSPTRPSRGR